ncbi:MAG: DUF2723 domain-containing protein [Prevotellaceae bacterium]|jgi:tetratricopeptide (TPR) repeat protein|nr:DUF2723 domain-containing protein [Prevotellaceae bacterium]
MNNFKRLNNLTGWVVFAVAAVTYLLTIEPTTSFWDCGEFIASSYKLEVGHPPGNPLFQMLGRLFSMFVAKEHAAMMINSMSALCSAFTILFLFWTITHLARRLMERGKETALTQGNGIAVLCAGAVGALAYTFSDTFWFSAVEAEVYALSSLFTAVVFWAILRWEEEAGKKYANRWLALIIYLMGLSIGVHLLNLLALPAIVLVYYFKKYPVSFWGIVFSLVISVLLLAFAMWLIPALPHMAGFVDRIFVNSFGLPFNSGAVFFVFALFALLAWVIYYTHQKKKYFLNTVALCFTMFVIGFTSFAMVVIRSSASTPTNENQPDNAYSLLYYLNREQYGSVPLLSGPSFATPPIARKENNKYVKYNGKYVQKQGSVTEYEFDDRYTMFFPRMHSRQPGHIAHYQQYISGRGKTVPSMERDGEVEYLPTFRENLTYFFDYQLGWMYWRYFMWNFAGRQNDIQGHGNSFHGNWECGIPFIDKARLGNIDEMPPYLANHKARNHYYLLPLLLGLAGLFYQLKKDKKNFSVIATLFILTGVAIVVYLNQTPNQPRERDYAYAGSFYAFTIWIGLGVLAVYELFRKKIPAVAAAAVAGGLCVLIPVQMGAVNWDDHNRSNRYTARDVAYNYLMSCEKNALIITVGDNDTFPLWYIQEVEGVRTDVRVVNTSLLSADWYIDQMRIRQYDSPPLPIKIARENYLAGTNDHVWINEQITRTVNMKEVTAGGKVYSPPRNLILPVNKENVLKNGTVRFRETTIPEMDTFSIAATIHEDDLHKIPDAITITIPKTVDGESKNAITKTEMALLDILANNDWERPIYFVSLGGDVDLGLRDYLQYDGFAHRLTPFRNASLTNKPDIITAYDRLKNVYRWGNINRPDIWIDYNTFLSLTAILNVRNMHVETAEALLSIGEKEKAIEILDLATERMPDEIFPYCMSSLQSDATIVNLIEQYYAAGDSVKADAIAKRFIKEADENLFFYTRAKSGGEREIDYTLQILNYLASVCYSSGHTELSMASQKVWLDYLKYLRDRKPYLFTLLKQKYRLEDDELN